MSKPLNFFEGSIERATNLLALANQQDDAALKADLVRSAAVIAVAAYDHYFTSKFCDVLATYLSKNEPNRELVDLLDRAGLKTKTALEIAVMKRPFRRIRSLVTKSLSGKTTNQTKAIDNLFAALELKGLSGRIHKACNRKNLGKRIDKLVEMRNDVVHAAHINSHGKPRVIELGDVRQRVGEIELFVKTAEKEIGEWVAGKKIGGLASSTD